jgi:hypothetical protein
MPVWLIPIILQLIAQLPSLIQVAEQAFSGKPGSGAAKKEFVQNSVDTALNVVQQVAPGQLNTEQAKAISATAGIVIDATVAVMKTADVMKGASQIMPPAQVPKV